MFPSPEQDRPPNSLPFISTETSDRILSELDIDTSTQEEHKDIQSALLATMNKKEKPNVYEGMRNMAVTVFGDLAESNREFVGLINDHLKEKYIPDLGSNRDAEVVGMSVVLRAFDLETDHSLLLNFGRLTSEDLNSVRDALKENATSSAKRDILESVLNAPKIPEQQIGLRKCVDLVAGRSIHTSDLKEGAVTMYSVLSKVWGHLNPGPSSPGSPPPYTPPNPQ